MDDAKLAREFHEVYEELAPKYGWKTQEASAVPWDDVPKHQRELMCDVIRRVVQPLIDRVREDEREQCARVCYERQIDWESWMEGADMPAFEEFSTRSSEAFKCAAAIRARHVE